MKRRSSSCSRSHRADYFPISPPTRPPAFSIAVPSTSHDASEASRMRECEVKERSAHVARRIHPVFCLREELCVDLLVRTGRSLVESSVELGSRDALLHLCHPTAEQRREDHDAVGIALDDLFGDRYGRDRRDSSAASNLIASSPAFPRGRGVAARRAMPRPRAPRHRTRRSPRAHPMSGQSRRSRAGRACRPLP